jgi:hypothetical protein
MYVRTGVPGPVHVPSVGDQVKPTKNGDIALKKVIHSRYDKTRRPIEKQTTNNSYASNWPG